MIKVKLFTVLLISLVVMACNNVPASKEQTTVATKPLYEKLEQASWLLGKWSDMSAHGSSTEIWKKENDSTYSAESYTIADNDTVFYEAVVLEERGNEVHFIAKALDENDDQAISFLMTSNGISPLVFENPGHDFPTMIVYNKVGNDSIFAQISGMDNGKKKTVDFPFKKAVYE